MKYLDHLKTLIVNKSNTHAISNLNTDVDVPIWLSNEMIDKIDISIDDYILFPCTKYGVFPYSTMDTLMNKYDIFKHFNDLDCIKIIQSKFVFCDTTDHHLFIVNKLIPRHNKLKSKVINSFYNDIKFIFNKVDDEYKTFIDSIFLSFFIKTNVQIFNIIEKNISDFMSSKNFKEWSDNCKKTISKYIDTSKLCSKQFGEVFTPEWLIEEMVSLLPKFTKDMVVLDNASGIGNFSIVLIEKIMKDLEYEIIDEEERKKHIIENMIIQCELQIKNAFVNYYILDPENKYNLKIFRGSFLSDDCKKLNPEFLEKCKEWGIEKFDIVIGNPPYQKQVGPRKTQAIWPNFVERSFEICKEGGYVSLIHPIGWRDVDGIHKQTQNLLKSKNILYLEMHNIEDGTKTFGAKTPYDWYVIRNTENINEMTTIKTQDGLIIEKNINELEFIPNGMFDEVISLIAKDGEERVDILHSYSDYETRKPYMSKTKNDINVYPCVYGILKDGTVNYFWSSLNKGHFGTTKLIIAKGMNPTITRDYNGDYAMTQFAFGIIDTEENLIKIEKVITSDIFQKINLMTKYGATQGNPLVYPKILSTFRKDFWKDFLDENDNIIEIK
jgi:hypothetical protein